MAFAIGIEHTKTSTNVGTLLRSAYNFGASMIFTIGRRYKNQSSDTVKSWRHVPLFHFESWKDLKDHSPFSWIPVVVEICDGAVPLNEFHHPKQAIYILGPEDGDVSREISDHVTRKVYIPSKRCLNVSVAGSIVMYDRLAKLGTSQTTLDKGSSVPLKGGRKHLDRAAVLSPGLVSATIDPDHCSYCEF